MRIAIQYELGGKDAAYIREDADLDYCLDHLLFFALYNSGQNCYKAERFYGKLCFKFVLLKILSSLYLFCPVHEAVYDRFIETLKAKLKVTNSI